MLRKPRENRCRNSAAELGRLLHFYWLWAVVLILILATVQVRTILDESQTWDEGIHLAAGYSYLTTGKYQLNSEHPALGKMLSALPLYLFLHPNLDTNSEAYKNESLTAIGMEFVYRKPPEAEGPAIPVGLSTPHRLSNYVEVHVLTLHLTLLIAADAALW